MTGPVLDRYRNTRFLHRFRIQDFCTGNRTIRRVPTRMGGGTAPPPHRYYLMGKGPPTLQASNVLLQIWAICPHGSMGPMMRRFFLNDQPHFPLLFGPTHQQAANMYRLSSLHPGLTGILPLADATWKRTRQPHEKFYGHSYTAPTPSTFFLQQFGLACTKAFAIHLRRKPSNAPVLNIPH